MPASAQNHPRALDRMRRNCSSGIKRRQTRSVDHRARAAPSAVSNRGTTSVPVSLADRGPVVADDFDGVRVGVEHPDLCGGGGQQHAHDPGPQLVGLGGLHPADLGV